MPLSTIDTASISGLGYGFKNRIINGGMVISQRGTSAFTQTTSVTYSLDRWATYGSGGSQFTVQQLTASPPTGYKNYLGVVNSGTPVTPSAAQEWEVLQYIEGYNIADLGWGAAGAQSVTLSFWVKSSVIGSFGASLCNYNSTRTYPFSYTVIAANTWEQKTITVTGDTTGTWNTDNTIGIGIVFSMGAGSSKSGTANTWAGANYTQPTGSVALVSTASATWQVTGVQLEAGTVATSFDWRPYGTELALCYRYFEVLSYMADSMSAVGQALNTTSATHVVYFQKKRTTPTVTVSGPLVYLTASGSSAGSATSSYKINDTNVRMYDNTLSGLVAGNATTAYANGSACTYSISAEL